MKQPPKKIRVHYYKKQNQYVLHSINEKGCSCQIFEKTMLSDFYYILLSEHEKLLKKEMSIWLDKDQEDLINECQAKLAETEEKYDSAFNELLKVRAELRSEKGNAIAIKKQLAEMQKEIKSNCEQHEIERQDLMKVIDHWKRSYNQAADEREEAKNMLLAVVRKLPIPKDVKMFKMQKCAACEKELVLHCPDDCP